MHKPEKHDEDALPQADPALREAYLRLIQLTAKEVVRRLAIQQNIDAQPRRSAATPRRRPRRPAPLRYVPKEAPHERE